MNYLRKIKETNVKTKLIILGSLLVVIGLILTLPTAFAAPVPVKSVTIASEKLDYSKKEPGSFNIEKSAKWIESGKARITFDVNSVAKIEDKKTDIIFVLDVSGSMDGAKLDRVKQDSTDLISTLLSDSNNRAALITFETSSKLVLPLTNNKDELVNTINNLTTGNMTNYYQALVNVAAILKDYKKETDRECIVLFLTDGFPNEDIPNEEGQYQYLIKQYSYLNINAVQYEMGTEILDPIKKISDNQFIADMTNLNNVLFEASVASIPYDTFEIVDYIDDRYFEIESVDNIYSNVGNVKLEYENKTPKVIWNLDNLSSGRNAKLTIDVNLKGEYLDKGGLYPTNKKEEIKAEIDNKKEDITSTKTPILSTNYNVIYDGNAPDGCSVTNVPNQTNKTVFSKVEIDNTKPICKGYQFKGWEVVTEDVKRINEDYFIMPESDVVLKAIWTKVNITKSMDGNVYVAPPPVIQKVVNYSYDQKLWKYKNSITKIVFEDNLHEIYNAIENFDISQDNSGQVIAYIVPNETDTSTYTAYIQGNGKVIANANSSYLFYNFSKLVSIEGIEYFDTSKVTNMYDMFSNCSSLTSLDLSSFNTSKVTNMPNMFNNCKSLTSLDLSSFDTRNVTNMSDMFSNCSSLTSLDVSSFDTSKVTDMNGMFSQCDSLNTIDLNSFNTGNVTNMSHMFSYCSRLTSLDLSSFDTSKVTKMDFMFCRCNNLTTLDLSNFNTSRITNMNGMFYGCGDLISLDLSNFDTSKVINMASMFTECSGLTTLDLSNFNTSNVTDMNGMFSESSNLTNINLSNFDTSKVTNMNNMFNNCSSLISLNLSNFNTSNTTNMNNMFNNCSSLISLNLSNFNTSKVTTMSRMFKDCNSLTTLDLSSFNTVNVTDIVSIFAGCESLISLDLSNFNTSKITDMTYVFNGCTSLRNLNLSSFNTSNVTGMSGMFEGCSSLTVLDLNSFDTSNVRTMGSMFEGCSSLTTLDLNGFDTSKVANMYSMFSNCHSLTTTITIMNTKTTNYNSMFSSSATNEGAQITVNYTAETSDLVDKMIATKSRNSNVVKGALIS